MTRAEKEAYHAELKRVAKKLAIAPTGDVEDAIVQHCLNKVRQWITAHSQPETLTDLLALVTTSLNMQVEEISGDDDLELLLERISPYREPAMARIPHELNDDTDAIMIQRARHEPWEQPFLAVINCRGWHAFRSFFTKWHEVAHLLLSGQQLQFAFRRTPVLRKEPGEVLVDKVAAALAFFHGIFEPAVARRLGAAERITFEAVDEIRGEIAPEASRHSTLLACLRHCRVPVYFVRCGMGYKKKEELMLASFEGTFPPEGDRMPTPRLRVREAAPSPGLGARGIRIHRNMRVPESSVVATAFHDPWVRTHTGRELLQAWRTSSSGPIGYGELEVEAVRFDEEVWALLHISDQSN